MAGKALIIELLEDGRIRVLHPAKNSEFIMNKGTFQWKTTYLLEYYREGTTELSPLVVRLPQNEVEFFEPPKETEDEFLLELWCHRQELFDFAEAQELLQISYLTLDLIGEVINKDLDRWKSVGQESALRCLEIKRKLEEALEAESFARLLKLYEEAISMMKSRYEFLRENICNVFQAYCDSLGIYASNIKCKFCPFLTAETFIGKKRTELLSADKENEEELRRIIREFLEAQETLIKERYELFDRLFKT